MPKLLVKSDYANQEVSYKAGAEIIVDPEMAEWLMRDSPGSFEKAPDEPVMDKMIGEPLEKKSVPELKKILKAKGLPVGGKKADLIERLGG